MKVITMYLPQFHRVKENDEWWGEGFTEWTTVKGAAKLFETHYQPHIPLGQNYYNLLDKKTMEWQADLMKKYGIDGQCIYHYWFEHGRQILEKPVENLLRWKDVDMPFCLCWANETWARSWSNVSYANAWADIYEKKGKKDTGILLKQEYGDVNQWKKHFDYLLSFFMDDRYIKVNGCPVFIIYKSAHILCLNEMMEKWNEWAREKGIEKIYMIGANGNNEVAGCLDSLLYHEPQHALDQIKATSRETRLRFGYDEVWQMALSYPSMEKNVLHGGFVGYDETPRRGKQGTVIDEGTPAAFRKYLSELIAKNMVNGNELIFVNAWNEWGESMHLEPDEKNQYAFLEAVPYAKEHYKEYLPQYKRYGEAVYFFNREIERITNKSMRYQGYWKILDAWLCLKENNISIEKYFIENNIKTISIYGMGMLGKHLLKELENGKVKVKCIIDRQADKVAVNGKVCFPDGDFPESDLIVVTVAYEYEAIKMQLLERGYKNIVSLEQIILDMM